MISFCSQNDSKPGVKTQLSQNYVKNKSCRNNKILTLDINVIGTEMTIESMITKLLTSFQVIKVTLYKADSKIDILKTTHFVMVFAIKSYMINLLVKNPSSLLENTRDR
jgi:hypothetical protein